MKEELKATSTETEIIKSVSRLLLALRREKRLTQDDVALKMGVSRQVVTRLESGTNARIDIVTLAKAVEACGEDLFIGKKTRIYRRNFEADLEDDILNDFDEGRIAEANKKLEMLKGWQYTTLELSARSKREIGMALSLYFNGKPASSVSRLNKTLMGLALNGYKDQAAEYKAIYHRVIESGEKHLMLMISNTNAENRMEDI